MNRADLIKDEADALANRAAELGISLLIVVADVAEDESRSNQGFAIFPQTEFGFDIIMRRLTKERENISQRLTAIKDGSSPPSLELVP